MKKEDTNLNPLSAKKEGDRNDNNEQSNDVERWSYELMAVPELKEANYVITTRRWWRCWSTRKPACARATVIGGGGSSAVS
jgi:hypothetical protein